MGHAQGQAAKERNWGFHAGAWLLRNTVHGDRYVPYRPGSPTIPSVNQAYYQTRSFARSSFSLAMGGLLERRLYKGLWVAASIEFVGRPQKYVFDADTLAAYPPILPAPHGLWFKEVKHYWYGLEYLLMAELKIDDWVVGFGGSVSKQLRTKGQAIRLDGSVYVLYEIPARNNPLLSTIIPRILFGYDGIGHGQRFRLMLGADIRKNYGAVRRWVDVRLGASVRIGK